MASTYSPNLRLELIGTGEQQGTWGTTTNTNLGTLLEEAIGGYVSVPVTDGADTVLTTANGGADQSRNMTINLSGALTGARNVICPAIEKLYVVKNSTTGGFAVTFKVFGQTGVTIENGQTEILFVDGTDARPATSAITSSGLVPITAGGTGASTASSAATNLGLGTGNSPQFTGLTLTGVGAFSAGTALLPSLIPSGDANTGMWFPAADTIAWSTGGVEQMRIGSTGLVTLPVSSGNRGFEIGTGRASDGISFIDLIGDTVYTDFGMRIARGSGENGSSGLQSRGTGSLYLWVQDAGNIQLITSNTERMRIRSDGKIGVGSAGNANRLFLMANPLTGAATMTGFQLSSTIASDVTSDVGGFATFLTTSAASFTITSVSHFNAIQAPLGAGSAVTLQYGFSSASTNIDATNNYAFAAQDTAAVTSGKTAFGFYSAINTATGGGTTWAFYGAGTAPSYFAGQVQLGAGTFGTPSLSAFGDTNTGMWFPAADTIAWSTGGSERMRVTSVGKVLMGGTSAVNDAFSGGGGVRLLQLIGSSASFGTHRNDNTALSNALIFTKARGTAFEAVADGDILGIISFQGANGSAYNFAAEMRCIVNGVVSGGGANDMPGALTFSTTPDGSGTVSERMRIRSDGNIGIGGVGNANASLSIQKSITGGAFAFGAYVEANIQSDVNSVGAGFNTLLGTAAASFSLNLSHYRTSQGTFGAGSTVNIQYGFHSTGSLIGANENIGFGASDTAAVTSGKNAYGFYSAINIATGGGTTYGFYAAGTARNLFSGDLQVFGAGGLGYTTGSGGAVTQGTSRTTGVTLNKTNGAITLFSAAGTTTWQSFTVTNSTVAATDTVIVCQKSGTDLYELHVTAVSAGSFRISFCTTGGTTTEQPVFNFAVIKAVTA